MSFKSSMLAAVVLAAMLVVPAMAVAQSLDGAATSVEGAILGAMSKSGQPGQPTLEQLGGAAGGSTDSDASGGAGSEGGSGGGGGCFAPETLVLMSDGTSKPVADIKVGDKVASWDFAKNVMVAVAVEHIYTVQRDLHFLVDGISVTAEHPFCTAPGQYTEVQSLKKGTLVASVADGSVKFVPVAQFAKVDETGTFFNMTVSDTHVFIVSPANQKVEKRVVHNKGGGDGR